MPVILSWVQNCFVLSIFFWLLGGTVVVGGPGTGKNSAEMHVRMGRTQKLL